MTVDPREMWRDGATLEQIAKNENGTYNGVRALSAISGLSTAEVEWTWRRMVELKNTGLSSDAIKATLKAEAAARPWEK
jgi:hypothetical protein